MSQYKWWILRALSPTLHEGKKRPPIDLKAVNRLLIVRPEKLGDVFVSLPLADEIHRIAPHVRVSIIVSPRSAGLVANDPRFEQVFVYQKNVRKDLPMIRRLRAARFDVVVDLVCNDTVTNLFLTQLAARGKSRIGMGKDTLAHYYDVNVPYRSADWGHVIDSSLRILSAFGQQAGPEAGYAPAYASESEQGHARQLTADWKRQLGVDRLIGINVAAGEAMRLWPDDKWVALINRLAREHNELGLIVMVPPEDRTRGESIVGKCRSRAALVPPGLGIGAACALIGAMNGLITPDTILVHAARSYHVPVVGLYTRFMDNYHMWYPYGQPDGVVLAESSRTIADIGVDEVVAAFTRVFGKEKVQTR
jgi:ADP-heptose:LPS heptosyltransferase